MKGILLAIAAMAFATLAPFAVAATATVGVAPTSLAGKVDALATTVTANHTTIVGKFAPQMAVVMSVPGPWASRLNGINSGDISSQLTPTYLVGESTIPGFPLAQEASMGGSRMPRCRRAPTFSSCSNPTATT